MLNYAANTLISDPILHPVCKYQVLVLFLLIKIRQKAVAPSEEENNQFGSTCSEASYNI